MTAERESLSTARRDVAEWLPVKTSDYRLRALRDRHYAGGVGGRTVGQPGRRIAFVTFEGTAGWVSHWPDPQYVDHAWGDAFVCTLFRNEGAGLSSLLIEDAISRTELRWGYPPTGGWLTFVDPDEVASPNPGYCFKCAGFVDVGRTKDRGLIVLRRGCAADLAPCDCRACDWVEGDNGAIRCEQCGGYTGEPGTSIRLAGVSSRRVRMELSDGAHMDVNVTPDASPETLAALRSVGEAAADRLRNEDDGALRNYLAKPKRMDE